MLDNLFYAKYEKIFLSKIKDVITFIQIDKHDQAPTYVELGAERIFDKLGTAALKY